jgi:cytochrome c556
VGGKPTDGLESKINALDKKKTIPAATVEKESEALIQMAKINIAMAEITKPYFQKPKGGKGKKDWEGHSDAMKKASQDLIKAVKAKDGTKVKTALGNINNACNNCHSDFRD